MRNSTPPWLRRLSCFSLDPRVVRLSHLATLCLKALETFTVRYLTRHNFDIYRKQSIEEHCKLCSGDRRGSGGDGHVGWQRPKPDAERQADRHRRRGRQHQDPHRCRHSTALGSQAALVPVLEPGKIVPLLAKCWQCWCRKRF